MKEINEKIDTENVKNLISEVEKLAKEQSESYLQSIGIENNHEFLELSMRNNRNVAFRHVESTKK